MEIGLLRHDHWIDQRYEYAKTLGTWFSLIPYPCLLLRWQSEKKPDTVRIATVVSHMRGRHLWCLEKCLIIDKWIRLQLVRSLVTILRSEQENTNRPLF